MATKKVTILVSLLACLALLSITADAQLRPNFYSATCPNLEAIVRNAVRAKISQTFVTIPATLRLFFHDCMVRGCDASVMIASPNNQAEKDHPDNLSLAGDGFDTVVRAKAAVDSNPRCRNRVSCADILALATRDVVNLAGGPNYQVELGRRDGRVSTLSSVTNRLPGPGDRLDQLRSLFFRNGLSSTDLVALSGAHTLGFSHCSRFANRIFPTIDRSLNPQYAAQLRQMCPRNVDPRIAINMDPGTPRTFDNQYFKNLQNGRGLFTSDQILFTDKRSRGDVNRFAANNGVFFQAFSAAMTRLGRVGVLTGNQGEIRIDCTRPN